MIGAGFLPGVIVGVLCTLIALGAYHAIRSMWREW